MARGRQQHAHLGSERLTVVDMRFGRRQARRSANEQPVPRSRIEVDGDATTASIVARIREVDWRELGHAYGAADDARPQLEALTLGTRRNGAPLGKRCGATSTI